MNELTVQNAETKSDDERRDVDGEERAQRRGELSERPERRGEPKGEPPRSAAAETLAAHSGRAVPASV